MMPFAGDWVSEAITKGIDPDDIGLCLPPAGPSGKQTTAIGGDCWVINAKADQAKKMLHGNTSNITQEKTIVLPIMKILQQKALQTQSSSQEMI